MWRMEGFSVKEGSSQVEGKWKQNHGGEEACKLSSWGAREVAAPRNGVQRRCSKWGSGLGRSRTAEALQGEGEPRT